MPVRGASEAVDTSFGERLRALREAARTTQAELADRAGLSVNGISALERGAPDPELEEKTLPGGRAALGTAFDEALRRGRDLPADVVLDRALADAAGRPA